MCISPVFQATLGFLFDIFTTSMFKLTPLRFGQTWREPFWLEVFDVPLAALDFIIIYLQQHLSRHFA
jgi:hypothetical protein